MTRAVTDHHRAQRRKAQQRREFVPMGTFRESERSNGGAKMKAARRTKSEPQYQIWSRLLKFSSLERNVRNRQSVPFAVRAPFHKSPVVSLRHGGQIRQTIRRRKSGQKNAQSTQTLGLPRGVASWRSYSRTVVYGSGASPFQLGTRRKSAREPVHRFRWRANHPLRP
jgi:hypothetical protein